MHDHPAIRQRPRTPVRSRPARHTGARARWGIAVVLLAVAVVGVAAAPARADDAYGHAASQRGFGANGARGRALVEVWGWGKDEACGFLDAWDCASVRGLGGRIDVRRLDRSVRMPNLLKIQTAASFEGIALDVYVAAAPSVGFRDGGNRCVSPVLESRPDAVRVSSLQRGVVCRARTLGYVRTIRLSATGWYRIGDAWHSLTASTSRRVGA
jgi:hypothetical protein